MSVPIILAVAVVVLAVVVGVAIGRQKDPQRRAGTLIKTGLAIMTVFTLVAGAFIGGYAMDEPGGQAGLMLLLSWAAPALVLVALAWFWPAGSAPLLVALTAVLVGVCVWFALDPAAARGIQNATGPMLAVGVVALAFVAAVLGLERTRTAGWLLLTLGAVPLLLTLLARSGPAASLAAASVVPLVTGVLYLVAGRLQGPRVAPGAAHIA